MGSHFTLTFGLSFMKALIESVSSASSVGDDDQPEIRRSPEIAPMVAVGGVPAVPPHALMMSATNATTASDALRTLKESPPVCYRRAPRGRFPLRPHRTPAAQRFVTETSLACTPITRTRPRVRAI